MTEDAVYRDCPSCGSADVPTLVVRRSVISLRCRSCGCEWSDNGSSLDRVRSRQQVQRS
jgi:uncharacterized Zn finger protein